MTVEGRRPAGPIGSAPAELYTTEIARIRVPSDTRRTPRSLPPFRRPARGPLPSVVGPAQHRLPAVRARAAASRPRRSARPRDRASDVRDLRPTVVLSPALGGVVIGHEVGTRARRARAVCRAAGRRAHAAARVHAAPTAIACSSSKTCSRRAARRARRCRSRSPPAAQVVGAASIVDRSGGQAHVRRAVPCARSTWTCRPTSPTPARCARRGCRSSSRARGLSRQRDAVRRSNLLSGRAVPCRCFKLTIAYDGTGFVGWQRQADRRLDPGPARRRAARSSTARPVAVAGAGRTDAGVHALGQVASADARARRSTPDSVVRALNARLPAAVRVLDAVEVPAGVSRALRRAIARPIATASGTATC